MLQGIEDLTWLYKQNVGELVQENGLVAIIEGGHTKSICSNHMRGCILSSKLAAHDQSIGYV